MECPICKKEYKNNLSGVITTHLIKKHNYTKQRVKEDFPHLFVGKREYDYGSEIRTCIICGKEFEYKKHHHRPTKKTCSKECADKLISNIKTKKVKSVCEVCGGEFQHKPSKSPRFCSALCKYKSQEGKQDYKIKLDTDEIKRLYEEENLSCETIGRRFNCGKKLIRSRLIDLNVELRDGYYSSVEDEIVEWLKSLGINNIEKGNKSILNIKELDIYLTEYKLAIEYNGLYWHGELKGRDRNYHLNKTLECEKQGIELIHIFEDEWINNYNIVKSIIKGKLGLNNKIYARKCELRELKSSECKDFLDKNHLQGYIPSKINIGLYYEGELVSLLTFRKSRYNKKHDWEVARFATKLELSVVGGFAKMLKYFQSNHEGSIITYSDKRYFDGKIYENNGFTKLKPSAPNYYYTKGLDRQSRLNFQKHKLEEKLNYFNPDLTEWENMQMNGWDRIWDCGNNVFILD